METQLLERLASFRKELHQHPELSNKENETASRIHSWVSETNPDKVIESIGGTGLAFIYDSGKEGPTVLFRCELDALPIKERTNKPYKSENEGVGHLCGHDGHMVMLSGLAEYIGKHRPEKGRAVLLFQPAEETGSGAAQVIQDEKFKAIEPDYAFAIHNLPGFELHEVILAEDVFSAASIGLEVELMGKTSHAAEPENGINPAHAVARIINSFQETRGQTEHFDRFVLITIIQVLLGKKAFGTSAGHALLRATLRAYEEKDFNQLLAFAKEEAATIGSEDGLEVEMSTVEEFPVTRNHPECNEIITDLAEKHGWSLTEPDEPFRWSEDFGHFTKNFKAALIGLGSGKEQPKLHNSDYDFPDELIPTGVGIFSAIYDKLLR